MFNWGLSAQLLCLVCSAVIVTGTADDSRKLKSFTEIRRELSQCGRSHYEAPDAFQDWPAHGGFVAAGKRIVGGEASRHGEWPWLVSLRNYNVHLAFLYSFVKKEKVYGSHFCGGVLIHPRWVLSARHCFVNEDEEMKTLSLLLNKDFGMNKPQSWTAVVGEHEIEREDKTERRVQIRKIFLAPNITDGSGSFIRDVALLHLDAPVRMSRYARPACLPEAAVKPGDSCVVAGWGKTSDLAKEHSAKLFHAPVKIRSPRECASAYGSGPWKFHKFEICAAGDDFKTDSCQFDSGGPLMCKTSGNRWAVSGIVSRGGKCAEPGYPGIYSSVRQSLDWIAQVVYYNQ